VGNVVLKLDIIINEGQNKMKEDWIQWKPLNELNDKYYIELLKDSTNGLEIILAYANRNTKNKRDKIKVNFGFHAESYRFSDEHCRLELFRRLEKHYGNEFYAKWNYFKVENSEYINWLNKESGRLTENMNLKHYVFMDSDTVLDVIAKCEPEFDLIKKKFD